MTNLIPKKSNNNISINKSNLLRFSLLLLEDGEYYLNDFSIYKYKDPQFTKISFETWFLYIFIFIIFLLSQLIYFYYYILLLSYFYYINLY